MGKITRSIEKSRLAGRARVLFERLRLCAVAMTASILAFGPIDSPRAQTGATSSTQDLLFVSNNHSLSELAQEITRLYLTLYNSKRLSVRNNVFAFGRPIEKILRDEDLFFGTHIPVELNSLLCDLNTHVCKRILEPVSEKEAVSLSTHLAGYKPSEAFWSHDSSNAPLVLPDIRMRPLRRWITTYKAADKMLEELVVNELGGCDSFDQECRNEIVDSNRKAGADVLNKGYSGPVTVPVLRAQAEVNVSNAAERPSTNKFQELRPNGNLVLSPGPENGSSLKIEQLAVPPSHSAREIGKGISLPPVLRELNRNLIGGGKAAVQGQALIAQDFAAHRGKLISQIGLPFRQLSDYPAGFKNSSVAIFDRWVDDTHCAFEKTRYVVKNVAGRPQQGAPANCDILSDGTTDDDHGTHVAGLIGAALTSVEGHGVAPYAKVATYEVELAGLLLRPASLAKLAQEIDSLRTAHKTEVVNMSFGYMLDSPAGAPAGESTDPVEDAIFAQRGNMLFVAAAGNYGANKSNICDIRPACFNMPNVIAVAALGSADTPQLLKDRSGKAITNYGSPIHVGAPGEEIFSTVSGGRYGLMSGSSQASPIVAAVASMAMSKWRKLTPQEIKNRLIYCSDHVGSLYRDLFGGRLDAGCVLDAEVGRTFFKTTATGSPPVRGQLVAGRTIHFRHADSGRTFSLQTQNIRGLHLIDPSGDTYVVYFNAGSDRDSPLVREVDVVIDSADQLTVRQVGTNTSIHFGARDVVRYSSHAVN